MKSRILAFIIFVLVSAVTQADTSSSSPSCSKPDKPSKFYSQLELDSFNNEVQRYQRCLYDFVDLQEEAIQKHQEAANVAIDEWNNFVRMELN